MTSPSVSMRVQICTVLSLLPLLCVQVLSEPIVSCHRLVVKGAGGFVGSYQELWGEFNGHAVFKGPKHKLFFAKGLKVSGWSIARRTSNKGPYDEQAPGNAMVASPASHLLRWRKATTTIACEAPPPPKIPPAASWKKKYAEHACASTASFHVSIERPKDCSLILRDGTPACAQRGIACDHTAALDDCMVCAKAWGWPYLTYEPLNTAADERCIFFFSVGCVCED